MHLFHKQLLVLLKSMRKSCPKRVEVSIDVFRYYLNLVYAELLPLSSEQLISLLKSLKQENALSINCKIQKATREV